MEGNLFHLEIEASGAPGSGKSILLDHLARLLERCGFNVNKWDHNIAAEGTVSNSLRFMDRIEYEPR